jgi:uncharacterized protein
MLISWVSVAQRATRYTYHDVQKRAIKEAYQVKDTVSNIANGRYISYFVSGAIESKGQFLNNETTGVWEFFYENGNLRMRGVLRQNTNYGLWEFYFENGGKSMEGVINEKNKEGDWKIYYESGELKERGAYVENKRDGVWQAFFEEGGKKGEGLFVNDEAEYVEYYASGKVFSKGKRVGAKNEGIWTFYDEEGRLLSEGTFKDSKKNGLWKNFYVSGKISSEGNYENDQPVGTWRYYLEDGFLSSTGSYLGGKKNGYWSSFNRDKSKKSEITYTDDSGEYKEYFPDGKVKVKGQIVDGKNQGKCVYYFNDGKVEGEGNYDKGRGTYMGFYPNGKMQTKGEIDNDIRIGTWEMYDQDGKLSGYYKPFYDSNGSLTESISQLAKKESTAVSAESKIKTSRPRYFTPKNTEYLGVILAGNPMLSFIGSMPFGVEFYNEERLGHEFAFEGLRNPFFTQDSNIPQGQTFSRGYAMAGRQKYYNPMKMGMWYFGQELRFSNTGYFSNVRPSQVIAGIVTANAAEQTVEYGWLLGMRFMRSNRGDGITVDAFASYSVGYRSFVSDPLYTNYFEDVKKDKFAQSFRFGLNIGYSLSFDGSRRRP